MLKVIQAMIIMHEQHIPEQLPFILPRTGMNNSTSKTKDKFKEDSRRAIVETLVTRGHTDSTSQSCLNKRL